MYVVEIEPSLDSVVDHERTVHLERQGFFREDIVMFWAAELASALEYLHCQRICHRRVLTLFFVNYITD